MPPKSSIDYVQRLISAEEERNRIIATARQKKTQKVRLAKADAERAVSDFRKEKDAELARHQDSLSSSVNAEKATVSQETEKQIIALRKIANQRTDRVADILTGMICNVDLDSK